MCFRSDPNIRYNSDPAQIAQDIFDTISIKQNPQNTPQTCAPTTMPPQYTQSTIEPSKILEKEIFP